VLPHPHPPPLIFLAPTFSVSLSGFDGVKGVASDVISLASCDNFLRLVGTSITVFLEALKVFNEEGAIEFFRLFFLFVLLLL